MLACPMISWSIFGGYPAWIIVSVLARDGRLDLAGQESGSRDSAGPMRLRRAKHDAAADVGEGPPYVDAAAAQADVTDPQGGGLAPAQARVTEQQQKQRAEPVNGELGQPTRTGPQR
jgi:hypothetical protein